ncbi:GNAT family N-acetyltransferase [Arcanobacterium phocisimile]|uniref:GNAT family N-acetyltransferase n=1 Tax=Arcanobacterium phocisimile TaxID=1302235 RepID=A0ABX7IG29_9ACTO|nr:GNAT family N-acetyltransferase [Arcanobacterium phocisimile]QRV01936.1 GNAT family N-acetyltransferase [Arcanobacterium phocisimile]
MLPHALSSHALSPLTLRPLTAGDEAQALRAQAEFAGTGFDFLLQGEGESWDQYLSRLDAESKGMNLPPGRVPATFLAAFVDEELVGRVSIRHELNEFLLNQAGHIGYAVRPAYRCQGFATEILQQSLRYMHSLGVERALVTCDETNVGSRKVIEACGGVYENTFHGEGVGKLRYWFPTAW